MRFSLFFLISGNWLGMLREAAFFRQGYLPDSTRD